ncbi:MAG TPA: SusD/RagB family nutrient-binding outer membrane lipoprotein, partial [Bacteroidales bacterium]|nr:SusD/RagB family nutrient-binding outer membrane lipoprotein [Bacteroidales bacterium]
MKAMLKKIFLIISLPVLFIAGCTDKFDEINKDPNNPVAVETGYLLTYSQKTIMDNLRNEWFAGRGTQLLCQHWSQNNYPDEDRYLIRTTTIQNAWRAFYRAAANLQQIIKMNTDEATKADARASGPNEHQIAVAMILKAYIISIITDTWGDVPYSECFNPDIRQPKYDAQADIYPQLIEELKDAAAMINPANGNLTKGDIIYGGNVAKWKKFANSLRLRLALRMSSKDAVPLNEVKQLPLSDFFESNDDNAKFKYLDASPNEGPVYRAFFVNNRNDFTITKPFVELLAG